MKIVGLTGNIGAGKSIIARIVNELGFPVFSSDWVGKKMIEQNEEVRQLIKKYFGNSVFNQNQIEKRILSRIVFKDPEKLKQLNAIIHPRVAVAFEKWKNEQSSSVVFREAAILIESGMYHDLDEIVLVTCPENIRLQRVMKRDGASEEEVRVRMHNQMSESEKKKMATYIIVNDEKELVLPQVNSFLKKIAH